MSSAASAAAAAAAAATTTALLAKHQARQMKLIEQFRLAGATTPSAAIPRQMLGTDSERLIDMLIKEGVLVVAAGGLLYFEEQGLAAYRSRSRRVAWITLAVMIAIVAVLLLIYAVVS